MLLFGIKRKKGIVNDINVFMKVIVVFYYIFF